MLTVSPDRYRKVVWAALVALAVIVVTGAAVRLTESGLGCTDWPTCEQGQFAPESSFHGWIEFGNRLFTGVVSAAVILAVLAARRRRPYRPELFHLALGLVAGVLAQAVLGGITVLVELHPVAVIGHFLLSMVLLANAVVLLHLSGEDAPSAPGPRLVGHSWGLVVLAALVLVTGTVVTGTGPHGGDSRAERLPLELAWVARLHASVVWLFVAVTVVLALRAARAGDLRTLRRVRPLLVVAVAQGAVGYLQYALGVPPALVALHIAGAIGVWCAALWVHLGVVRRPLLADWPDVRPSPAHTPGVVVQGQHEPVSG